MRSSLGNSLTKGLRAARAAATAPRDFSGEQLLDWCYEYLPTHFYGERAEFHQEIAELLATNDRVAIAAPRSHNKSTLVSLGYALFMAAHRRASFIVILGASRDGAEGHLGNVLAELMTNERLITDYPHIAIPNPKQARKTRVKLKASDFVTTGGIRFTARGTSGHIRGLRDRERRPDLVICDDVEEQKHVATAKQRTKLRNWLNKVITPLFGTHGQLVVVGTILHKESLLSWLLSAEGPAAYAKRKYAAIITGDGGERRPLWPAARSLEWLDAKLDEIKSKAFAQEYLNDPSEDDGVMFKPEWIDAHRLKTTPESLTRIVVAVDPSTASDGQRDACGIIVAGKELGTGVIAIMRDLTLNGSPSRWGRAVLDAYYNNDATEVVIEANQGGAMVRSVLQAELRDGETLPPITLVHATRGKAIRAEPVAVAYEKGEVAHVGHLTALEKELAFWTPDEASPNRLDAMVWAVTALTKAEKKIVGRMRFNGYA